MVVRTQRLLVPGLLAALLLLLSVNLAEPWLGGHYGFNGTLRSIIGRNYVRYGFWNTRFAPVQNIPRVKPRAYDYRWNHPMLINACVGVSYRLFGETAWATRLPFLLFAWLGGLFLFLFVRLQWNETVALWALFFYTFCPHVAIYGAMPNYEAMVITFALGSLYAYARWRLHARWWDLLLGVGLCTLGFWTDWPFWIFCFFAFVFMTWDSLKRRSWRQLSFPIVYAVTVLLNLAFFFWYYISILHVTKQKVQQLFKFRTGASASPMVMFKYIGDRAFHLLTPFLSVTALLVVLLLPFLMRRRTRREFHYSLLFCSMIPALIYLILFKGQAYIHCFSSYYLVTFVVLASAAMVVFVLGWFRRWHRWLPKVAAMGLVGSYLWMAYPVILEGHYTNGSPFEGRKVYHWRHVPLAKWLRKETRPDQRIVFMPYAPAGNSFTFRYYHGRRVSSSRYVSSLRSSMRRSDVGAVVVWGKMAREPEVRKAMKQIAFAVFERYLVLFPRKKTKSIRHVRLEAKPFTWFHRVAVSMTQPPFRVVESDLLVARYQQAFRSNPSGFLKMLRATTPADSLRDQVALYNLLVRRGEKTDSPAMKGLLASIRARFVKRVSLDLQGKLQWLGVQPVTSPQGFQEVLFLLQAKRDSRRDVKVVIELKSLKGRGEAYLRDILPKQPGLHVKKGELLLLKRRFHHGTKAGRYRISIRVFGKLLRAKLPVIDVRFRPFARLLEKTK